MVGLSHERFYPRPKKLHSVDTRIGAVYTRNVVDTSLYCVRCRCLSSIVISASTGKIGVSTFGDKNSNTVAGMFPDCIRHHKKENLYYILELPHL